MDSPKVFIFYFKMMDSKGYLIKSSKNGPVSVIEGKQQIFEPLEKALLKLRPGDQKRIAVNSKDAYGEYNTDLVVQVPQSKFERIPRIGDMFNMESDDGSLLKLRMADVKNGICILDGNHQLAGVDLFFEVEVLKLRPATLKEIRTGKVNLNRQKNKGDKMKLYVGNLKEGIAENDLRDLFSPIGELVTVNIIKDKYSGNSKGFGFVEFESHKLGQTAITKFDGHLLDGVKIKVNEAREKKRMDHSRRY